MKTALVAGATGLVGNQVLSMLLASDRYSAITALTRRPLGVQHPKLRNVVADFRKLEMALSGIRGEDVFCCLGTTMSQAGSKKKFYEVDFEYPHELARVTHGLGAKQYILVSALGADKDSRIYYNRVKGEVEDAIRRIDFECIHILRPSLLLGPRGEKRPGEDMAKKLYSVFGFAIPARYKAIDSEKVAAAMLAFAARDQKGTFIHESPALQDFVVDGSLGRRS